MTPSNKIKRAIIRSFDKSEPCANDEDVERRWQELRDDLGDITEEFRTSGLETNIPSDYSRHYECDAVAAKMDDGSWVGWMYWHGGGKHGNPESIDWIPYAYDLDCVETQEMVTVRKWSLPGNEPKKRIGIS